MGRRGVDPEDKPGLEEDLKFFCGPILRLVWLKCNWPCSQPTKYIDLTTKSVRQEREFYFNSENALEKFHTSISNGTATNN